MLRFIFVFVFIAILTIFLYPFTVIAGLLPKVRDRVCYIAAKIWAKAIIFVSGVKVSVKGLENIDVNRSYVFAMNHQSYFDIFVILSILPVKSKWMAKKELFYIPFLGWAMKSCDFIPVDRKRAKSAYRALKRGLELINQGNSIIIFPEGTRSRDGRIGPFKTGGIILALRSNRPIVPVTIIGTRHILPKGGRFIRPGHVKIIIDRPISTKNYKETEKEKLANILREIIVKNYEMERHF